MQLYAISYISFNAMSFDVFTVEHLFSISEDT